jgi:hypothetical protein
MLYCSLVWKFHAVRKAMIGFKTSQERQEMIEYMAPERTATDGQWLAIKCLGAVAGVALLTVGAIELAQGDQASSEMPCPEVVNTQDMPECK